MSRLAGAPRDPKLRLVRIATIAVLLSLGVIASAADARAQDAGVPEEETEAETAETETGEAEAAPTLEVELEPDPTHEPTPERVPILERIGPPPRREPAPRDVPFTVPSDAQDARIQGQGLELPPEEPPEPPIFGIAIGAGWTRQLSNIAIDYVRLEQRFEARIPDFLGFFVGVGVAELFDLTSPGGGFIIEVGPRAGFGAGFCDDRLVQCEGVVFIQPGIAAGDLGLQFDFQGALDLRFLFARLVELSGGAAISFIGGTSFITVSGNAGLRF